jgi:hypothetical protein
MLSTFALKRIKRTPLFQTRFLFGTDVSSVLSNLQEKMMKSGSEFGQQFLDNMPKAYFRQVSPQLIDAHLSTMIAFNSVGAQIDATTRLVDSNGHVHLTVMQPYK